MAHVQILKQKSSAPFLVIPVLDTGIQIGPSPLASEKNISAPENKNSAEEKWEKVSRKKPRKNAKRAKKNKQIVGNDGTASDLVAIPVKDIHAAGFRVDTSESAVKNYISHKLNISNADITCFKLVKSNADLTKYRFVNFRITMPESAYARALDPSNWPSGIRINKFNKKNGVALPAAKIKT